MAASSRRSARISSSQQSQNSSPQASQNSPASNGKKRKAESGASPSAKRGKKDEKEQKTIEDTMDLDKTESKDSQPEAEAAEQKDVPSKPAEKQPEESKNELAKPEPETQAEEPKEEVTEDKVADDNTTESNGHTENSEKKASAETKEEEAKDKTEAPAANSKAVEPHARDGDVPSSILEKGIMYFLYRGRVNIDSPDSVTDIQRSFLLLRPLPHGAKLGDGPISTTSKDCRLIAIPKKTLPTSGNDKWTGFVEKSNTSFPELKESFLKESNYETQTQGTQTTPVTTPAAEGVYAITTTGRETHLAYIVTLPSELGEIQHDLGVRQQGSFILSTKNPKAPGPSNANLGTDPGFSEEISKEFRSLRWMPTKPEHLNYEYCQFLMIGEGEKGLEKATEAQEKDIKNDKSAPLEEMEKLEEEDEIRVKHLDGEDAVYKDLGMDSKSYPGLQTTW